MRSGLWGGFALRARFVFVLVVAAGCSTGTAPRDAGSGFDVIPFEGGTACSGDYECDDRVACTIDECTGSGCSHRPCLDCCEDGLVCVPGFGCREAPTPCTTDEECSDVVRCTLDFCRDATACAHDPQPGLCDPGEICLPAAGCIPEPPSSCTSAADCEAAGAFCVGEWSCDPEFGCQFVSLRDCDDGDACTIDACDEDAAGCAHPLIDEDGDGHAPTGCGDDCDDANMSISPDATEICDGSTDEDCDGAIDEGCCEDDLPCPTSCGSEGRTLCEGGVSRCVPPAEACNAADDDCDLSVDEDFECARGASEGCAASCGTMGTRTCDASCGWSACAPPAESCNGEDDDCDGTRDEGFACIAGTSSGCLTSCGSTGTRVCLGDCSFDACVPPAETCNGVDDDCDGAPDDGFPCVSGRTEACATSCGSTGMRTCDGGCGWGACVAPAESCNGADDDCDGTRDEGFACIAGTSGSCTTSCGSTGSRVCLGDCSFDGCVPPAEICNGVDDDCDLACDDGFACCQGSTRDCTALGFYAGTATCRSDCGAFDTSTCTNCGNGLINAGEQCDGTSLGGASCTSIGMGFNGGTLGCGAGCVYDTSLCTRCGNGVRESAGMEQCDGMDLAGQTCASRGYTGGGTLACSPTCAFDTSMCIWSPTGTWVVSPGVNYYCAFGLVSFSFGDLTFNDTGAALSVSGGGLNCTMTGASARVSRMFDVSCSLPGGCTETYRLVGTFTGDNTWTGTFTAQFVGGSSCYGCSTMSWTSLTGTR